MLLTPQFLKPYYARNDVFPNLLARSVYLSKYKRVEDSGWSDTVRRVVEGNCAFDPNVGVAEAETLYDAIWHMRGMPSGRGLWTGGVPDMPIESFYNCYYTNLTSIEDWAFTANSLMCGGGVGVGFLGIENLPFVVKQDTASLYIACKPDHPNVEEVTPQSPYYANPHYVADSREGWVAALKLTLKCAFEGKSFLVDVTDIRPRGALIKTFGGIACGPGPLVNMLRSVYGIVRGAADRKLTSVECLDITNHIGLCIKSGNVRRSALLTLSDPYDTAFRKAKQDLAAVMSHRHTSNNSLVFTSAEQLNDFDWFGFVEDNRHYGDPGLLNLEECRQVDPGVDGINPCLPPETLIHTRQGHFKIVDLVGKVVDVWDGNSWRNVSTFAETSQNEHALTFTMYDGSEITVTDYHTLVLTDGSRIEAKDIKAGQLLKLSNAPTAHGEINSLGAYLKGFLIGDGCLTGDLTNALLFLYAPKYMCKTRLLNSAQEMPPAKLRTNGLPLGFSNEDDYVNRSSRCAMHGLSMFKELIPWGSSYKKALPAEVFAWNLPSKLNFIAGVMDSDGTASDTKNGFMYQLSSTEKAFLLDFQALLKTVGVFSKVALNKKATEKDFNDGYGFYKTKDCWRLTISQISAVALAKQITFSRLKSFADKQPKNWFINHRAKVVNITDAGVLPKVYCLVTEDPNSIAISNGYIIGRCGEIPLHHREACCLSEVYPALCQGTTQLLQTLELITRYTLRQRLQPMQDPQAEAIRVKNMRIGVGLGGLCDFPLYAMALTEQRNFVQFIAKEYAQELGVNTPIATTTVKPSGTISLLNGSSPGMHAAHAPYYLRRIRLDNAEPMAGALLVAGVPAEPCQYDATGRTLVFSFPMQARPSAIVRAADPFHAQIRRQALLQANWADNAVSTTLSFDPEKNIKVAWQLKEYAPKLKSLSLLAETHSYPQAPYEAIMLEQYAALSTNIDTTNKLTTEGSGTDAVQVEACEGGVCGAR